MTRLKISICILAALIGVSVFSGVSINKSCTELIELTEQLHGHIDAKRTSDAEKTAGEFLKTWRKFRKYAAVMIKSDKLSEIDSTGSRIIYLIESDSDEVSAEVAELRGMLELLLDGEKPIPRSIF